MLSFFILRRTKIMQVRSVDMTKIIMHGCNGAMGQVISKLVQEDDGAQIVAGIDISGEEKERVSGI